MIRFLAFCLTIIFLAQSQFSIAKSLSIDVGDVALIGESTEDSPRTISDDGSHEEVDWVFRRSNDPNKPNSVRVSNRNDEMVRVEFPISYGWICSARVPVELLPFESVEQELPAKVIGICPPAKSVYVEEVVSKSFAPFEYGVPLEAGESYQFVVKHPGTIISFRGSQMVRVKSENVYKISETRHTQPSAAPYPQKESTASIFRVYFNPMSHESFESRSWVETKIVHRDNWWAPGREFRGGVTLSGFVTPTQIVFTCPEKPHGNMIVDGRLVLVDDPSFSEPYCKVRLPSYCRKDPNSCKDAQ